MCRKEQHSAKAGKTIPYLSEQKEAESTPHL